MPQIGIAVDWSDEKQRVPADCVKGLAVHRVAYGWNVTHVKSGLALGPRFQADGMAYSFRSELLGLGIEWEHVTVEQILAREGEIRRILDRW